MFLTNNQADKMNFLSGLIVIYNRMNNSHTSISGREDRSGRLSRPEAGRYPGHLRRLRCHRYR